MGKEKKERPKNRNGGRKKVEIDWGKVDTYLMADCDGASVARLMGLHPETLYGQVKRLFKVDFSAYREQKRIEGVSLMEGSIFRDALERGGVDRMFWLKNKATWADRQQVDHTTKGQKIGDLNITVEDPATIKALKDLLNGPETPTK
jgi:hypothetical protein